MLFFHKRGGGGGYCQRVLVKRITDSIFGDKLLHLNNKYNLLAKIWTLSLNPYLFIYQIKTSSAKIWFTKCCSL